MSKFKHVSASHIILSSNAQRMTVLVNEVAIHEQKGLAGGNAKFLGLFRGSFALNAGLRVYALRPRHGERIDQSRAFGVIERLGEVLERLGEM